MKRNCNEPHIAQKQWERTEMHKNVKEGQRLENFNF